MIHLACAGKDMMRVGVEDRAMHAPAMRVSPLRVNTTPGRTRRLPHDVLARV
jgi:hypothetical protein